MRTLVVYTYHLAGDTTVYPSCYSEVLHRVSDCIRSVRTHVKVRQTCRWMDGDPHGDPQRFWDEHLNNNLEELCDKHKARLFKRRRK